MAAKVQGTVTDFGTGLPVAGHLVTLYRDGYPLYSTRTSASGVFRFANLDPGGRWDLRVAGGTTHGVQWWPAAPVRGAGTPLSLNAGATTTADATVIRLAEMASLAGTVVDAADGVTPLPGIQARVLSGNVWMRTATTDGSGQYTVTGLLPGTYTVRLVDPTGGHWGWWDEVTVAAGTTTTMDAELTPIAPPLL
jgi:hypothetical protein